MTARDFAGLAIAISIAVYAAFGAIVLIVNQRRRIRSARETAGEIQRLLDDRMSA